MIFYALIQREIKLWIQNIYSKFWFDCRTKIYSKLIQSSLEYNFKYFEKKKQ
jgi:hypothetical protein